MGTAERSLDICLTTDANFTQEKKITECAILTIHLPLAQLGAFKLPLLISEDGKKLRKRHSTVSVPCSTKIWQFEEVAKGILSEDKIGVLKASLNASC